MKIINASPHPITLGDVTYATGEFTPRLVEEVADEWVTDGIKCCSVSHGDVEGLPTPAAGTIYVVSVFLATAMKDVRADLAFPYPLLRDDTGRIVGAGGIAFPTN